MFYNEYCMFQLFSVYIFEHKYIEASKNSEKSQYRVSQK